MPLIWQLTKSVKPSYSSDTHWTATSGRVVVGTVGPEVFAPGPGGLSGRSAWHILIAIDNVHAGVADTIEQAKAALEAAWWAWVEKIGLMDREEPTRHVDVVFVGEPGPVMPRFVELADERGRGLSADWVERPDGYWALAGAGL